MCVRWSPVCSERSLIPGTLSSLCFTHTCKLELSCQVQHHSKTLMPPQGLELTKVAFSLNTLSLSGVKNKACQSLTACREKDINYSRQRVERSCLEWEFLPLSCHLLRVTSRAEVGPNICDTAGQEEPAKGFLCWLCHPHRLPCLQTKPLNVEIGTEGWRKGRGGSYKGWSYSGTQNKIHC